LKDGDRVICGRCGSREAVAVRGIQPARLDLLQIADGCSHVVAKVVNDTLNSPAVKEMAISIRELRLQNAPLPPSGDGVSEGEREQANDRREEVSSDGPIENIAEKDRGQAEVCKGCIERRGEIVAQDAQRRLPGSNPQSN
jgi:hypothetical protein